MTPVLVKLFATALALSQVTTRPDDVRTHFDSGTDQAQVVQLLQAGCAHVRQTFGVDNMNLDDLIATAMRDPQTQNAGGAALHGVSFDDLFAAYREFCKNEPVAHSPVDVGEVIDYFDQTVANLPDYHKLKNYRPPGQSMVLDGEGGTMAQVGARQANQWVPLDQIPDQVQNAFVAAEDKRFYQHHGIDEDGMIRAFANDLTQSGRLQGGSTITQQVVKNLLTGNDTEFGRKIREIILASRVEHLLSKQEILALYLNSIYLGRGAWGVGLAAQRYFGKPVQKLSLDEGALLAGLTKGPSYFDPDRHPDRARERFDYVLDRMQADGMIGADQKQQTSGDLPTLVAYDPARRDSGFYPADDVAREAKAAGFDPSAASYTIHSTIHADLQRATEAALQEGLADYELHNDRARFTGAEANLANTVARLTAEPDSTTDAANGGSAATRASGPQKLAWQRALEAAHSALYDVHWPTAIVLSVPGRRSAGFRVGLRDGRVLPLVIESSEARRQLKLYDLIFVNVVEGRHGATAELRMRPSVQGAAVVLDNKSGAILAITGGFSYPLSQLDRVTQSRRQPGSALKPVTYLAALEAGLQPNTLVLDEPITFPPINAAARSNEQNYWSPHNYEHDETGAITLRRALEQSRNLATAHLLDGAIARNPPNSLDRICELAVEAQLYQDCKRFYPFVLGAQSVRVIDLAAFYAAIANEGVRPVPHAIDTIEQDGNVVYRDAAEPASIGSGDPGTFYQLKSMLQGVVQRGTAHSAARAFGPYVAGKTGTTEDENDAWFVGFTNDVTIAVWVGYDNAGGERRTLGDGQTGAEAALPIFETIVQATWADYAPRAPLAPPSPQARRELLQMPIDYSSGDRLSGHSRHAFMEYFHLGQDGQVADTQYRLVSRRHAYASRESDDTASNSSYPAGPPPGWASMRPPPARPNPFGFLFGGPSFGGGGSPPRPAYPAPAWQFY